MPSDVHDLKRKLKRGPRMSRELRAEFLSSQINGPPRRLRPATLEKLRAEVKRLALSTNPRVQEFVGMMAERYPEMGA
jgi:hypothetical protein